MFEIVRKIITDETEVETKLLERILEVSVSHFGRYAHGTRVYVTTNIRMRRRSPKLTLVESFREPAMFFIQTCSHLAKDFSVWIYGQNI